MKNIVVIGGSGGIGQAVVREFLDKNCNVLFSYCGSEKKALGLVAELKKEGQQIEAFQMDITDKHSVEQFAEAVEKLWQKIDAVIYCSGIVKDSSFLTMSSTEFDEVLDVNLRGCYLVIKELFPLLNFKEGAGIVAVSSTGGIRPSAGQANYAASKAGVIAMMESLAREYAKKRVRVNVVAPGFIHTDMVDLENKKIQKSIAEIPMGRLGEPKEVAKAVYFLASEEASYITAQTLIVDGGRL